MTFPLPSDAIGMAPPRGLLRRAIWWAETVGEHWRAPVTSSPIEPYLPPLGFGMSM